MKQCLSERDVQLEELVEKNQSLQLSLSEKGEFFLNREMEYRR